MGITRIEQAIDEIDPSLDDAEASCEDIRLAWLANELDASCHGENDFDALWTDR
jgi:hypothetical protein